jgi:acyl carrier protein
MTPSTFMSLDALPLTANGKVDRRALPIPEALFDEQRTAFVAPRNPTERALAEIWARVLKCKQVGIHHNFFDLGGHSLLATEVMVAVRDVFNVDVPLLQVFENPTISGLADVIKQAQHSNEGPHRPAIMRVNRAAHHVDLSELAR